MFRPGDIVRIKKADEVWQHLVGQVAVFITEVKGESFPQVVKPLHCACQVKFAEDDLEYICSGEEILKVIKEAHI